MTVTEVLKERGWSHDGWEDGNKVCIIHAVCLALNVTSLGDVIFDKVRDKVRDVAPFYHVEDGLGNWNDRHASYEDVMLVAKMLDTEWGL